MKKLTKFFIIVVAVFIAYLIVSKAIPTVDAWMGENVFTPIGNTISSVVAGIVANPTYQTYFQPNLIFIGFIGGIASAFVFIKIIKPRIPFFGKAKAKEYPHEPSAAPPQILTQPSELSHPKPQSSSIVEEKKVEEKVVA